MILLSHSIGNMFFKELARSLAERNLLAEARMSAHFPKDAALAKLLPRSIASTLARRAMPPATLGRVRTTQAWREIARMLAPRLRLDALVAHETGRFSVDRNFQAFDRSVARRLASSSSIRGVYAYEDGAASSFKAARETGKLRLYDLPIGYWRAARDLLSEEAERLPEWASTLHGNRDSPQKTDRKDLELSLAEHIFVASAFTRKTLQSAPDFAGKVHVVPYGAPAVSGVGSRCSSDGRELKILYVGSLGQRKGLAYLKAATEMLKIPYQLTIIGKRPQLPCAPLDELISKSRYIPSCPHSSVLETMRQNHVFIFPSLFEGFGLVLLEAMSQGMAVIATPNTAGPDIISNGEDGVIVPIRDAEAICATLTKLHENRDWLDSIRERAIEKAGQFTWGQYGNSICDVIEGLLQPEA